MAEKKPLYITTTLPYVNADPHIGFTLEIVQADIIARYNRLAGRSVFFSTGTDEHGQKLFQKAQEAGQDPQAYVDHYAARFGKLKEALNLSNDAFIRTTSPAHIAAAQELWRRCEAAGDIYKKKYKGLYCVGDEAFLKEGDLVDGKCPNHPTMEPQEIEEENYFFRLSNYQAKLLAYLAREDVILPGWRREEAVKFVEGGLEDFSVSREKARMSWGIPVPGDDTQVMYVWFDALTNYISTTGWPFDSAQGKPSDSAQGKPSDSAQGKPSDSAQGTSDLFKTFWQEGEVVQMAGKDQVRFQSIMWQAMLMSGGIKNTDTVVYHGFITSNGQKMSKSLGNVVEPFALVDEYGTDAVRFFLARHTHPFEDSDYTAERFKDAYNADLANGLGNLASRVMTLAQTHLSTPVEVSITPFPQVYTDALERFEINKAAEYAWQRIAALDQRITAEAPFKVAKEDPERGRVMITEMVRELAAIDLLLEPILPETSRKIIEAIMANKKPENLFPRKE